MNAFIASDHPRGTAGRFTDKVNDAPTGELTAQPWVEAGGGCTCLVNPNPATYYGTPYPGEELEPDPDCPVHFPIGESDEEWTARNEAWADAATAGEITEPDASAGTAEAWTSTARPF